MEIKYIVNGQKYSEEVTEENLRAANQCYDKLTWEAEIEKAHPIINHYQKHQWAWVTRFNGWLPLPPTWLD